jgi:hypothetical protein
MEEMGGRVREGEGEKERETDRQRERERGKRNKGGREGGKKETIGLRIG